MELIEIAGRRMAFHRAGYADALAGLVAALDIAPVHLCGLGTVAEALRSAIPAAKLVVLPGVGHETNLEAPEAFNNEVRRFLGQVAYGRTGGAH